MFWSGAKVADGVQNEGDAVQQCRTKLFRGKSAGTENQPTFLDECFELSNFMCRLRLKVSKLVISSFVSSFAAAAINFSAFCFVRMNPGH